MESRKQADNWNGFLYKNPRYTRLQRFFGEMIIEKYVIERESSTPNAKGLDIGCGDGFLTDKISKILACEMHGIDKSASMIDAAKSYQVENKHVLFYTQDIGSHLNTIGEYSFVVSFFCLHWVLKQEEAYQNIAKLLKEDGRGYLLVGEKKVSPVKRLSYIDIIRSLITKETYRHYFSDFCIELCSLAKENFPRYIENAGLKVNELIEIHQPFIYDNKAELSRFFHALIAGYLMFKDDLNLNDHEKLSIISNLCDELVDELITQGSCQLLDNGQLQSQQNLLLAIIEKPRQVVSLSPTILLGAADSMTKMHDEEKGIRNAKIIV